MLASFQLDSPLIDILSILMEQANIHIPPTQPGLLWASSLSGPISLYQSINQSVKFIIRQQRSIDKKKDYQLQLNT